MPAESEIVADFFLARAGAFFTKWANFFSTGAQVSTQMLSPYEPEIEPVPTLEHHQIPADTATPVDFTVRIVPFMVSHWKLVNSKGDFVALQAVTVSQDVFLEAADELRNVKGRSNRVTNIDLSANSVWTKSETGEKAVFIIGHADKDYVAFLRSTNIAYPLGGQPIYRYANQGGTN
jgi:hypothetical protein